MGQSGHFSICDGFCTRLSISFLTALVTLGFSLNLEAGLLDAWQDLIPRGKTLGGVTCGNGQFLAAGGDGALLTSTNSANWQLGILPIAGTVSAVAFGNGVFVAVGSVTNQGGLVLVSSNSVDWTTNLVGAARLDDCAFGNGHFVAVGNNTLLSSTDGLHWTSRKPAQFVALYGVDFVEDHFVALGAAGLMLTSSNGIVWSTPTNDTLPDLYAAASGSGVTVMVGKFGRIRTISSTGAVDVVQWDTDMRLWDIAYGNGRFAAVGFVIGLGVIYTSTNGFNWEQTLLGEPFLLDSVVFANGEFIAVGYQGAVLSSTNGLDWTLRRGGIPAPLLSVAAARGQVLAVGGFYNTVGTTLSAADDLSWQIRAWDFANYPLAIISANDAFLVVGSGGIVSTSPDGHTWTHQPSAVGNWLNDVIYTQGIYLAVGYNGQIESSADGINWTNHSVDPATYLYGVTYGAGRFVTVGYDGVALTSTDGAHWAGLATGVSTWLHGVAFGQNAFVAVGDTGTILRSTNGQSWVLQASPTTNALYGVRYLAGRFLALGSGGTILSSTNGIAWQQHSSGVTATLHDAIVARNRVWIVGELGTALISQHEVYPELQSVRWLAGLGCEFALPANLGRPCRVQCSSDLTTWQDLVVIESWATNRLYLDCSATNQPVRFYRASAE